MRLTAGICLTLIMTATLSGVAGAQGPTVSGPTAGPDNTERYRVDRPTITAAWVAYPTIQLRPGDTVTLSAGGCAQTGGSGKTWRRYVDPQGPNSEAHYHGLVQMPRVLSATRLQDIVGKPIIVPVSLEAESAIVLLGYEDDNYADNGYWGRDDGVGDQCKNQPDAFVELTLARGVGSVVVGAPHTITFDCDSAAVRLLPPQGQSAVSDADEDGITDLCEQRLAERYAPLILHPANESAWPVNVDWMITRTSLWYYDDACSPDLKQLVVSSPSQAQLLGHSHTGDCGSHDEVRSDGTRSEQKQRTFFLNDLAPEHKQGSLNSLDWTTYVHAYRNDRDGVTLQYWRTYSYNVGAGPINHGGDWEGFHLILDRALHPIGLALLGHKDIDELPTTSFQWDGPHVRVFSAKGGHTTTAVGDDSPTAIVRHETWPGGQVRWANGSVSPAGQLINLGEKRFPLNGQVFLQYSGLWGSPGTFYASSGYWGPAYNETGMDANTHFIAAWCRGMASPVPAECTPRSISR